MSTATSNILGLIGDIGATNARFAIADEAGVHGEEILKCEDYPTLKDAAEAYLVKVRPTERPRRASIAIAGPVVGDRFEMTNHAWSFSIEETRQALKLETFNLLNDFKALALAVPHLEEKDLRKMNDATVAKEAPIGIIGPGTGLGVASLIWDGGRYVPVPGEGGHVTMPAKTQREFDIFRELVREKYHHVSAERVCSGKGLANLYQAICSLEGRNLPGRTPEDISTAALRGTDPLCTEALDLMIAFLGRIAGNLALTLGAHGGIYVAGGIVNRLGGYFYKSTFIEEFVDKGRFRDYMEAIPVFTILHPFPAFVGLRADLLYGDGQAG